jgi:hypothetical protein
VKVVLPIAIYRKGIRYKVAEAMIDVEDGTNVRNLEIDITRPILTEIKKEN